MRRIPSTTKAAAPAKAAVKPAAAAKPAAKKAEPAKPAAKTTAVAKTNGKQLPSLAGLDEIGAYEQGSVPLPEPRGFPWIGFFTTNSKNGRDRQVTEALGSVAEGHPYVLAGDRGYHSLAQLSFVVLAEMRYWACLDKENKMTVAFLEEQPFGAKALVGGKKEPIKDCVMAIVLILPGAAPLPEALALAQLTVCDFRGTKSPAVLDQLRGIEESMTPEWAEAHGDLAGKVPPRFRVASSFEIKTAMGQSGFPYAVAKAKVEPATLQQLEAVAEWHVNEDAQAEFKNAQEIFDQRTGAIRRFATGEQEQVEGEEAAQ